MKKNPDFIIIPHQLILDDNLQPLDRILYGVIYWLVRLKNEKCNASNKMLKELCGCKTNRAIVNSLNNLEKQGYILRRYFDDRKRKRDEIVPLVVFNRVGINDDTVGTNVPTGVGINVPTGVGINNEQNNKSIKEENINNILAVASATAGVDNKEIARVINFFGSISPLSYKECFGNKTERKSAMALLEKMPIDKLEILITQLLPRLNVMPYISKDCKAFKPSELLKNLDKIVAKIKELKLKRSQDKTNIVV